MQEAKNVYPSLGMIANVGLIGAGAWVKFVNGSLAGELLLAARLTFIPLFWVNNQFTESQCFSYVLSSF